MTSNSCKYMHGTKINQVTDCRKGNEIQTCWRTKNSWLLECGSWTRITQKKIRRQQFIFKILKVGGKVHFKQVLPKIVPESQPKMQCSAASEHRARSLIFLNRNRGESIKQLVKSIARF